YLLPRHQHLVRGETIRAAQLARPLFASRCVSEFFYQLACNVTRASPLKPRALAAAGVRSMTRPRTNGPRSLIRTTTLRPLLLFVTRTRVPNGSVRCAAVKPLGFARSPLAVRSPA